MSSRRMKRVFSGCLSKGHNYKTAAAELGVTFIPISSTSAESIEKLQVHSKTGPSLKRFAAGWSGPAVACIDVGGAGL